MSTNLGPSTSRSGRLGPLPGRPRILLSFDAEEFDAPEDFGSLRDPNRALQVGIEGWRRVLDLLNQLGCPATFFTTVRLAQAAPDLVQRLAAGGHELASHGRVHSSWTESDLAESRATLESLSGLPVRGVRRARFQPVDAETARAAGYLYDASEHPVWIPGRYNRLRGPRLPRMESGLVRLPASATPCLRLPLFWLAFKRYPEPLYRALCLRTLRRDGHVVLVFHPWEFCDLSASGLPRWVRSPDGERLAARLTRLIKWLAGHGDFMTCSAWVEQALQARD